MKEIDLATKHLYPRGEVDADFDFVALMKAGRPGGRGSKGGRSAPALVVRKAELRRRVGHDGMSLLEARELDWDAYADDLRQLRLLHADWLEHPSNQPVLGSSTYQTASVLVVGARRAGKETVVKATISKVLAMATSAGLSWSSVKPPGEHALETVGKAQIVHHEDVRHEFVRTYDDLLRYLDPNDSTQQAGRNVSRPSVAPHQVYMTTTGNLLEAALTFKARKSSAALAISFAGAKRFPPVDVDEFLLRLALVVEVVKPDWVALDDLAGTEQEMIVSIWKVRDDGSGQSRLVTATDRHGTPVGDLRTSHRLELVALVKGCDNAAAVIANHVVRNYSHDLATLIPEPLADFSSEFDALVAATPQVQAALDALRSGPVDVGRPALDTARDQAELGAEVAMTTCTCSQQSQVVALHADLCPYVSDVVRAERNARAEAETVRAAAKAEADARAAEEAGQQRAREAADLREARVDALRREGLNLAALLALDESLRAGAARRNGPWDTSAPTADDYHNARLTGSTSVSSA